MINIIQDFMALTIQFLLTIPDKYSPSYIIDTNLSITKCVMDDMYLCALNAVRTALLREVSLKKACLTDWSSGEIAVALRLRRRRSTGCAKTPGQRRPTVPQGVT